MRSRTISETLGDVQQSLGRVEGKLDMLLDLNLNERLNTLESWKSRVLGMVTATTLLISGAVSTVSYLFHSGAK